MTTAAEKEDLRHAVLEILASRYPTAHALNTISRKAADAVMFIAAPPDVEAALEFLREKGFASFESDGLGSTKYWKATAAGVQADERGSFA